MLMNDFSDFYKRWMAQIEKMDLSKEYDCYDAYFMLFVIYNRLYVAASDEIRKQYSLNNISIHGDFDQEFYQAINNIYEALGRECFKNILSEKAHEIQVISEQIDPNSDHYFIIYIDKKTKMEQKSKNITLFKDMSSDNVEQSSKAILSVLYKVRCNMFHGTKSFGPIQITLLAPLISILKEIVEKLNEKYCI